MKLRSYQMMKQLTGVGMVLSGVSGVGELLAADMGGGDGVVINVADYGALADGRDAPRAVQAALVACRERGATRLVFPEGRYDFLPDFAEERYLFISNNDEGLKRVVFPLVGYEGLTIDGQGSEFVFHGFVNPFLVEDSAGITFENFSVDFSRAFHSEGIIVAVHAEGMDVRIPRQFPYQVRNGLLTFVSGANDGGALTTVSKSGLYGSGHLLEFDMERRQTAYMARDYFFNGTAAYPALDLGDGVVRLRIPGLVGTVGNTLVRGGAQRSHGQPPVFAPRSRPLTLSTKSAMNPLKNLPNKVSNPPTQTHVAYFCQADTLTCNLPILKPAN